MARLRVGLIGCGHIAAAHVRAWQRCGLADVTRVFDVRPAAAQAFARRFRIPEVVGTPPDLIAGLDVVDDCSPPAAHLSNALAALSAGTHYLVEKPIVLRGVEFEQIAAAAAAAGRQVCVVHNLKYNAGVRTARGWVRAGRIGRLIGLERYFLTDPSTDRMLRMTNHWSQALPGGRWLETLPHELYLTYEFLGPLPVVDVVARGWSDRNGPHTADELLVALAGDSTVATFRYSARSRTNYRALVLSGTDGMISVDILAGSAALHPPRTGRWVRAIGRETVDALATLARAVPGRVAAAAERLSGHTPHTALIGDFARSLIGAGPPPVALGEIAYVVAGCEDVAARAESLQAAAMT